MRTVAYVTTAYPPSVGGVQLHCHELLKHLATRQRQWVVSQWDRNRTDWLVGSTILSDWNPGPYEIDEIQVRRLCFGLADRLLMLPATPLFYLAPRIFSPWIARVFRKRLSPLLEGADLIHAYRIGRENLLLAAFREARRQRIPFVFTPTHHPRWRGYRYSVYISIYRRADRVLALTESERCELVRLGVEEERVSVTGVGPILADREEPEAFRQRHGLDSDPFVLFLGQKFAYKGLDLLLEAARLVWPECPDVRFVFIGPGTPYSRKLFASQFDGRIIELDVVSPQEKASALAACTLLALPSRQESFGGVFTEAWSFKKPVIGGKIPAIDSVISDGIDGFTVPHDPRCLAERIVELTKNSQLAGRLGRAGDEKVRRSYAWDVLARKTEAIYDDLLGAP